MKLINSKALDHQGMVVWIITSLISMVFIFVITFLILEYFRLDFKYQYPNLFIYPASMTTISIFFIVTAALLLAIVALTLAKLLSKDCAVSIEDNSFAIDYNNRVFIIELNDIQELNFNNRGDYAYLKILEKNVKYKFQFGLPYAINLKSNLVLMEDITPLDNLLLKNFNRKDQVVLESNLELYTYTRK